MGGTRCILCDVRWLGVCALVSLLSTGCAAASLEQPAYYGARGAVRGTMDQLGELKGNTNINAAAHDLAQAVVTGVGDGASQMEIDQKVRVLLDTIFQAAKAQGNDLLASVIEQQGPRLEVLVRQTVTGTIQGAGEQLRKTAQTDLSQATDSVVTSALDAVGKAVDAQKVDAFKKELVDTTGQVTQAAVTGALTGLRTQLADADTKAALHDATESATRGALDGARQGLQTAESSWSKPLAIVFGVLLALAIGGLIFYIRKAVLTSRALTLIVQQINKGGHVELKSAIKSKAEGKRLERFLSAFLLDRGL
jgi:hypothetical protein